MDLRLDIEFYADREDDLNALFAELAAEDSEGAGDELPPIIQDEVPVQDFWGEAA